MKNLVFTIVIMVFLAFHANAQKKKNAAKAFKGNTEAASITVKKEDEIVKYKFDTIKDFEENSNKILDEITITSTEGKADKCEVTVEISVTVNEEFVSTTVSGSVTTSCATVSEAVKALRTELITSVNEQ
jgi:hypothetical protein